MVLSNYLPTSEAVLKREVIIVFEYLFTLKIGSSFGSVHVRCIMFDKTDMHCVYMMYILYTLYLHCLYQTTATKSPRYQDNLVPDNNEVKFDAVDLYVPEQCWRENEVEDDLVCILYVILFSLSFTFYPMCLCLELRNFVHSC